MAGNAFGREQRLEVAEQSRQKSSFIDTLRSVGRNDFENTSLFERLAYNYFNWREDAYNDLQLLVLLNVGLIVLAGAAKKLLVDNLVGADEDTTWWSEIYDIMVIQFG